MPTPLRSAARAASTAAPAIPFAPPTIASFFRVPLCALAGIGGTCDADPRFVDEQRRAVVERRVATEPDVEHDDDAADARG